MDAALAAALHAWAASDARLGDLVSLLAEDGIFLIPLALIGLWVIARPGDGRRQAIVAGGIAALLAAGLGLYLERTLARARPFVDQGFTPLVPHVADSSFPSDHTLVGVALAGALLLRAPRVGAWLVALALLVGFARVAVGLHYPSDIIGSAIVALIIDWLALRVATLATGRARRH